MSSRQCPCCSLNTISLTNFDCGHIISAKNDGLIKPDNLIPICGSCNKSMESNNMNQNMILSSLDWKKIKKSRSDLGVMKLIFMIKKNKIVGRCVVFQIQF